MDTKFSDMSTQKNQYEVDLNAIKEKYKKSEYTEFTQVRLMEKTKKELVELCRQEGLYVSTLLREIVESYLQQMNE